ALCSVSRRPSPAFLCPGDRAHADLHSFPTRRSSDLKIAFLAVHAWGDASRGAWPAGFPEGSRPEYDLATIVRWLRLFLRRFFGFAQFKRSAVPNGPKVSHIGSLSPRGDWRAPSDGNARAWLAELDEALPEHAEG